MTEEIKNFNEVEAQLKKSSEAWIKIVGYIRSNYIMDEIWDGNNELKFRHSAKTLATLYIKEGYFTVLIIFGKNEREAFELSQNEYSEYILNYYNNSRTYHDGKWMFIDIHDSLHIKEIINLIKIKKKPNRKIEDLSSATMGCCGNRCDKCLLYARNNEATGGRFEFQIGDWKCYHGGTSETQIDYSKHICNGCQSECPVAICVKNKSYASCAECNYNSCDIQGNNFTNPGRCNLGLKAEDIEKFVLPYWGKERFNKMKEC